MLSHLRISAAKPAAKPFNLSDGQGLLLTVQPNGSKLWKLSFRHLGKQKTLHLGPWPDVGLADARERRDEARRQIAACLDPAVEKKRARAAAKVAAANTFKDVADEWVQKCKREGRAEITLSKIRWLLGMAQLPVLAFDVMDDGRAVPGQKRRDDEADAFTRAGWRESHDMFGAVVTEIIGSDTAESYAAPAQ